MRNVAINERYCTWNVTLMSQTNSQLSCASSIYTLHGLYINNSLHVLCSTWQNICASGSHSKTLL